MPTDSQTNQLISRRDFLKLSGIGLGVIASKNRFLKEIGKDTTDLIVSGEKGENIWQVEIDQVNPTLVQAVDSVAPGEMWTGYGLAWIQANRQSAVIFSGDAVDKNHYKLNGKNAILAIDELTNQSELLADLPQLNPRICANGDTIVFGNNQVVEANFATVIRPKGKLSSMQQYLSVTHGYNQETQQQTLSITQIKRLHSGDADYQPGIKEWQSITLKKLTKNSEGVWKSIT